MESHNHRSSSGLQRQLANLKLVSRLLGHELHSQGSAKTVTLTREEVHEIQTTIDLFIEEVTRAAGPLGAGAGTSAHGASTTLVPASGNPEPRLVPSRN